MQEKTSRVYLKISISVKWGESFNEVNLEVNFASSHSGVAEKFCYCSHDVTHNESINFNSHDDIHSLHAKIDIGNEK